MPDDRLYEQMAQAVIDGLPDKARQLAEQALSQGIDPLEAINRGYKPGMDVVGEGFANGDLFIPDLMMSGEAMKAAIAALEGELSRRKQQRDVLGKVVIGTVEGDIHEIGKTLVATMLAANGFEVYDLGVDVSARAFVDKVREVDADVLGLSALLTTTILNQETVILTLKEAGLRDRVKVIIGGVPASEEWAQEIGADGYAENATEAVATVKQLVGRG
ncbi:MAG: cobalamin-binding protein [Anaerolineaceae bacterium]|nr:cobalamin-binding protein [Anaerolineaceae bacterium]